MNSRILPNWENRPNRENRMSNEREGMSRRTVLGATLGMAAAPTLARAAASSGWSAVDAAAAKLVADRVTPGLQIAVMKRGAAVYSKGFGVANLETGTKMAPSSVLRIGSVTKQFTAAALLRLQEQGKLSVDDKLSRFIPDFPRADDITLRQMLNHTSGLGNYTKTEKREIFFQRSRTDYPPAALLEAMRGTNPMMIGEPGAQFAYSNTAYVLLGLVIETITGQPYQSCFKANLFEPAGLAHTAVDDAADIVAGRVSGYSPDEQAPSGFKNASFISMTYPGGAGALRSTAEEMCRWHRALFGGRVLQPASLQQMTTPARLANGELPTTPSGPPPAPTKPVHYGMGVFVENGARGRHISHGGGIQGFISHLGSYPEADIQVAFVFNADNPKLGPVVGELRTKIAEAAFA
jgi:D-alanyl-D-alanine carboxypeptidase